MVDFKVSSPSHIQRILDKGVSPADVREMTLHIRDEDAFLGELLDDLAGDSDWPVAVPPSLIVDQTDESQLKVRAKNVVEMVVEQDVFGLNMLDLGCGTGHVSAELGIRMARRVTGYDIAQSPHWAGLSSEQSNLFFTDDWKRVAENAPYDHVLIYDVLDHVVEGDPKDILTEAAKLLAKDGFITMRCHPWVSRHGSHLYYTLNRAFAHVLFEEAQLASRGYLGVPTRKVIHPMWSYKKWIEKSGLQVVKDDKIQEPVEDYFLKNDLFKALFQRHFQNSPLDEYKTGKGDLARVLSFHFVDFTLAR